MKIDTSRAGQASGLSICSIRRWCRPPGIQTFPNPGQSRMSVRPGESKYPKFYLRNRLFACIFAIIRLHLKVQLMKRDIFQAIADPTRRAIMVLIAVNAMTPNAIAEHFDITRQATSKHIQILNECELLEQMKAGREIYYQLKLEKMSEIDLWLEQFRKLWEDRYNNLDSLLTNLKGESNER